MGFINSNEAMKAFKAFNTIESMALGIRFDGRVHPLEAEELRSTIRHFEDQVEYNAFYDFVDHLKEVLSVPKVTMDEIDDVLQVCEGFRPFIKATFKDENVVDLQALQGIGQGLIADAELKDSEIHALHAWMERHRHLDTLFPYSELYALLNRILEDGIISEDERREVTCFLGAFANLTVEETRQKLHRELQGISGNYLYDEVEAIEFQEKNFCVTGIPRHYNDKTEIYALITDRGGVITKGISGKTDFLIVGDHGDARWLFLMYGGKMLELKKRQRERDAYLLKRKGTRTWGSLLALRESTFLNFL